MDTLSQVDVPPQARTSVDPPPVADDRPRALRGRTLDERASLVGAFFGSLALVWIVYERILPFSGGIGFVICWYVTFLAMYAGVSARSNPAPVVKDRLMGAVFYGAAGIVAFALATTLIYTVYRGWDALWHLNFVTQTMSGVGERDPFTKGGIFHAIVGSGIQLAIAIAISLPLGLGTAVFLTEVGGRFGVVVRTIVEAMTAIPDLLAGLFVYVLLIVTLGMSKTGLAAAVALSVTMTPIVARSAEVALRVVPGGL
ncbi:MAG: hypothetical protein JO222_02605, partial [Frankiales bacterium]|nr:hypothetical protein [Frankiales bacterium]